MTEFWTVERPWAARSPCASRKFGLPRRLATRLPDWRANKWLLDLHPPLGSLLERPAAAPCYESSYIEEDALTLEIYQDNGPAFWLSLSLTCAAAVLQAKDSEGEERAIHLGVREIERSAKTKRSGVRVVSTRALRMRKMDCRMISAPLAVVAIAGR